MLERLWNSKLGIGLVAGCLALIALVSIRAGSEEQPPVLNTAPPDPNGTPRMRIGQSSNRMEQPARDTSLDELLQRR